MNKVQTKQVSFERGIIENVKQNSFADQQGSFASALYLENFNPNLEYKSLVKRPGYISYAPTFRKLNNELLVPEHSLRYFYPHFDSVEQVKGRYRFPFFNIQQMATSNPAYNDTYILFFKAYLNEKEMTLVAGHVIEYGRNEELLSSRWIWPGLTDIGVHKDYSTDNDWSDPASDVLKNNGWHAYGSFRDSARAGGYIVFCTYPEDIGMNIQDYAGLLYPVYKWGLWDVSKKRQKDGKLYWNGISDADLGFASKDDMLRWKVLEPSVQNMDGLIMPVRYRKTAAGSGNGIYTMADRDNTPLDTDAAPIQIIFHEDKGLLQSIMSVDGGHLVKPARPAIPPATEIGIAASANSYWKSYLFGPTTTDDMSWIVGLYKCENGLDFDRKPQYKWNASGISSTLNTVDNFLITHEIPDIEDYKTYLESSDGGSFTIGKGRVIKYSDDAKTTTDLTDEDIEYAYRDWQTDAGEIGHEIDAITTGDRNSIRNYALPHMVPNYEEAGTPRPFAKGERIPYIITFNINGAEVIVYKDTYEVNDALFHAKNLSLLTKEESGFHATSYNNMWCVFDGIDYQPIVTMGEPRWFDIRNYIGLTGQDSTDPKWKYAIRTFTFSKASPYLQYKELGRFLYGNIIRMGLRFKVTELESFIDMGLRSINIYVSEPDRDNKLLRFAGITNGPVKIPDTLYCKPLVEVFDENYTDYQKFRLVQSYITEGKGTVDKHDDYKYYMGEDRYRMNGWNIEGEWAYAMPQDKEESVMANANTFEYDAPPNFILWDYPLLTPPLMVNSSGRYWKGIGANVIGVVKNRVFIGDCYDENGDTEQGKDRFCSIANGVVIHDLFNDEDWIQIGHLRRTAILEYREQGWFFNRQSLYRVMMTDIADASTWEVLDAEHGAGTFSNKTVALSPYGVCFCNENGIWISDGRKPESLTNRPNNGLAVTSLYQKIAMNQPYQFTEYTDIGKVETKNGYNKFMELLYDELNDELVLITPLTRLLKNCYEQEDEIAQDYAAYMTETDIIKTHELRLIYSFANQNWRTEVTRYTDGNTNYTPETQLARPITYSEHGRMHFARPGIFTFRYYPITSGVPASVYSDFLFELANTNFKAVEDIYLGNKREPIISKIITHEIGDGINDCLLDRAILECTARDTGNYDFTDLLFSAPFSILGWQDYYYVMTALDDNKHPPDPSYTEGMYYDPILQYQLRSETHVNQKAFSVWEDLVFRNMYPKLYTVRNPFWSQLQTPSDGGDESFSTYNMTARESLVLLAPLHAKFRRARFMLCTEVIAKVNSLLAQYSVAIRKSFG